MHYYYLKNNIYELYYQELIDYKSTMILSSQEFWIYTVFLLLIVYFLKFYFNNFFDRFLFINFFINKFFFKNYQKEENEYKEKNKLLDRVGFISSDTNSNLNSPPRIN